MDFRRFFFLFLGCNESVVCKTLATNHSGENGGRIKGVGRRFLWLAMEALFSLLYLFSVTRYLPPDSLCWAGRRLGRGENIDRSRSVSKVVLSWQVVLI